MATEEPKYTVLTQVDDFELRRYDEQLVAQTWVSGDQDSASREGFKVLADYIFGNNTAPSGDSSKISMTAPVTMQADNKKSDNESQKIAMTAPVQQQLQNGIWKVSFVMPAKYQMHTLPKPNNAIVTINRILKKRYVVIQFSGLSSNENIEHYEKLLMQYVKTENIKTVGLPTYAFYNPPWTLPFMRRNEIMFEIENISEN